MAKRKRGFTDARYEKLLKEGRGDGIGKEYKPWIRIQDVPSSGRSSRLHGIKSNRQHDFLSDMETNYFYILEFSNYVNDIREQFPLLPRDQTITIAEELGVKHPTDPNTQTPIVMTTDFLITARIKNMEILLARTVKNIDKLDQRQIEKFEIERRYWEIQGVDWGIVTENEIDMIYAKNISICHQFYNLTDLNVFDNIPSAQLYELVDNFRREIEGDNVNVREMANLFDKKMVLSPGSGISIFKHLIINKGISIDLSKELNVDLPQSVKIIQ